MANWHQEDYHELPEFLRFNKYGGVLTPGNLDDLTASFDLSLPFSIAHYKPHVLTEVSITSISSSYLINAHLPEERTHVAKTKGVCSTCGLSTHKITPFRSIPKDNEFVENGICLKCHPDQRKCNGNNRPSQALRIGTSKSSKVLGIDDDLSSLVHSTKMAKRIKNRATHAKKATADVSRQVLAKSLVKKDQSFIANNSRTLSDPAASTNQRQTIADVKPWKSLKGALQKNDTRSVNRRTSRNASGGNGNYRRRSSESDLSALKKAKLKRLSQRSKTFGDHPKKEYTIDVWDIVKEMRLHPDNPQLLTEKCNDLRDKGINQAGSLYEIIDVMRRFPSESKLQVACIGALWSNAAEGGDDGKAEVRDAGGAEVIIAAIKCFPDNVDVVSHGLGTLSCLCSGYGGRSYLVDDEGIVLLLENILKRFADKEGEERGQILYWVLVCLNSIISDYGDAKIFSKYQESQKQSLDSSNRSSESYNSVQSSSFEESGKGWECEGCSMLNMNKDKQCEMCGNERDSQHREEESSSLDNKQPQNQIDYDAVEEECNVTDRSRDAIVSSQIISLVLQATDSVPIDGITLELALYFLAHFEEKQCEGLRTLLAGVCKRAVQMPQETFPILHRFACAIQCLTMNLEESAYDQETAKCFADAALDSLAYGAERHSSDIPQSPRRGTTHSTSSSTYTTSSEAAATQSHILYESKVNEIFLSLLSNLLCFGSVKLDSVDSEDLLDICCTALEDEGSSSFLLTVCYWVIWSIITYGSGDIKQSSLDAMDGILHTISNLEHSPTALTLGFAVIDEVVHCNDLEIDTPLIELVAKVVSKYPITMIQREAFQLLFHLCKTKEDVIRIVNTGVLNNVNKAVCETAQPCQLATNLLIKLSVLAEDDDDDDDDDILSIDDLQSIVSASFALKSLTLLAAKYWCQFLTSSIKSKKDVGQQSLLMALSSITEIMESFPNNLEIQRMTCLSLTDIALSARQEVDVSDQILSILNAQKVHGVEIHKECCDALWALMRIRRELNVDLLREVIYFAIEVTEIHVVCPEYPFSKDVVSVGVAIMVETLTNPQILGEVLVDVMVDVLNKCIYSYLDREEDALSIFEHGFYALQRLCDDDSCRDIVITHGGIVAVVDGMVAHSTNASIQQNGCHILWRLGENETDELGVKLRILEADGVDVLLNVMISHGDNGSVLAEAFQALSSLCVDKSSRNFVAQQGGIMMITTSLSTLPKDVHVQESGLAALCNLTSLDVDESLIDASTISSVVHESLKCHDAVSIQQKGLSLLYNLSLRSEGVRDILLSSSCLKNVSRALELHASSPQVISAANALLISLSDTEECTRFLLKKEEMNRIVQSMMMNVEDLQVSIVCCNILEVACEKNINNMGIGGVEAVLCTMKIHLSSEYSQDTGCRILAHLSAQSFMSFMWNGSFDVDFFDLTCALVDVIVAAMEGYHRNFQVQQQSINTLINVSKYDGNSAVLFTEQSRIEDVLAEAMERFPEVKEQCEELLQVFLT